MPDFKTSTGSGSNLYFERQEWAFQCDRSLIINTTGVAQRVHTRLRECSRQVEAEVVSNSSTPFIICLEVEVFVCSGLGPCTLAVSKQNTKNLFLQVDNKRCYKIHQTWETPLWRPLYNYRQWTSSVTELLNMCTGWPICFGKEICLLQI